MKRPIALATEAGCWLAGNAGTGLVALVVGTLVTGLTTSAYAQAKASVMECTLAGGPAFTLKVEMNSLGLWNPDAHAWEAYPCHAAGLTGPTCKFESSEAEYRWELHGVSPKNWDTIQHFLTINRRTARVDFLSVRNPFSNVVDGPATQTTQSGRCYPASDPALSPRAAPVL